MKILFVTPSYFPIVGGSEVLTQILSTKLNLMGITADIMTLNMNKKWQPIWKEETIKNGSTNIFKQPALNPFPGLPNPLFNLFGMNVVPKLSFSRKFRDYDVIHFVGEADLSFPIFSIFQKKPKLLHCVAIFRNGGIYKYYMLDRAFLGKIFTRLFPNLVNAFVVSSEEEKALLSDMGVPKHRIIVLPIGVDTKFFHPDETKKRDNLVLFAGRIARIKGLHILMKALSYVEIPLQLAIIGRAWDEEYFKEIEGMARDINAKGIHNVMLLGEMDQTQLVLWYQKASVLVCPYIYETYSNVIRESLACGTPVVSTGNHLLEGSPDGIAIVPKDAEKLADAISELLKNDEIRRKAGREGRRTIEQHFSWQTILKDLIGVYEDMISSPILT